MKNDFVVDHSVVESIYYYYHLGMVPGSFTIEVICQNKEGALRKAHPLLLHDDAYIVDNLLTVVDRCLPEYAKGHFSTFLGWSHHKGLLGAAPEFQMADKLFGDQFAEFFGESYMRKMKEKVLHVLSMSKSVEYE